MAEVAGWLVEAVVVEAEGSRMVCYYPLNGSNAKIFCLVILVYGSVTGLIP